MTEPGPRGVFRDFWLHDAKPTCRQRLAIVCRASGLSVVLFRSAQILGRRIPACGHVLKQLSTTLTGADIAWRAKIGVGLRVYHPVGVVIGPHVVAGQSLALQGGVVIGGLGGEVSPEGDSPRLGNDVRVGAGAKLLGPLTIGDRVVVGANSVVVDDMPSDGTVRGVPGRWFPAK